MFWVDLTFEWYDDDMVFRVLIFIFLFRTNVKKEYLYESSCAFVMIIFSKVLFWKLLDHTYVQRSFSRIARRMKNSILKEILQSKILQTCIKIRANTSIKTWENIMKENQQRRLENYHLQNNTTPHFKEQCTKVDNISFIVKRLFSCQTNIVFQSTWHFEELLPPLIYILTFWLLIFYGFWRSFSASTPFLLTPVKFWWRKFSNLVNMFLLCLTIHEPFFKNNSWC